MKAASAPSSSVHWKDDVNHARRQLGLTVSPPPTLATVASTSSLGIAADHGTVLKDLLDKIDAQNLVSVGAASAIQVFV